MKNGEKALSFGIALALAFGTLAAAPVATPTPKATPAPKTTPTHADESPAATSHGFSVETNDMQYSSTTGAFTAPQRIEVRRPGTDAVGDSGHGNLRDGTATLTGHVVVHDSGGAPEAHAAGAPKTAEPSTLTCDELSIDSKRKIYIATGNVQFMQGDRVATAQSGQLDLGAHTLDLQGDVHLRQGDDHLSAPLMHYDTITKDVHFTGGPVNINGPANAIPQPSPSVKATPTPRR